MKQLQHMINKLEKLENDYIRQFNAILIEEGMKAFVLWAKAFPTRDLQFVSGMGTSSWGSTRIESSAFLIDINDVARRQTDRMYWSDRYASMLQPLTDFHTLFWSSDLCKYPALPDIIYNPITKTVECSNNIIQL
jgi:hypothetical protein